MGVAAGIAILAALIHGLVGLVRRPCDRARLAFAAASLAAAVAALAASALYTESDMATHVAITKWAFFPASVAWTAAVVWFVAFTAGILPRRFLLTLTAGFASVIVADLMLPRGMLHDTLGTLRPRHVPGGSVMVTVGSSPHALNIVADALTVVAFGFLCFTVYRVRRLPSRGRARDLALMTTLLAVATLFDGINEYAAGASLSPLYLTQLSFAGVIVAVSLYLRREALRTETDLRRYRTHMDELVEARVRELDEARTRLAEATRERRTTEIALRRRVEELNALQRIAQIFAGRSTLAQALDQATGAIIGLFRASYAHVQLPCGDSTPGEASDDPLASLARRLSAQVMESDVMLVGEAPGWEGLPDEARRSARDAGLAHVVAEPLAAPSGPVGALIIVRETLDDPFTDEERQLVRTVGEALAAVIEIDRLYHRATEQAAAEERQALARDLHDAVTQSLYSAALIAEALPVVWERDPAEGAENLARLRRLVRSALAEMRTLLVELRPAELEAAPLQTLLERLGDALAGQGRLDVAIQVDDGAELPTDVKIAFYRVTQEAFGNVAKYAHATSVGVSVHRAHDGAVLSIEDDGCGFDPSAVPRGHMGLRIMDERLKAVGGSLSVTSAPGHGTSIEAVWRAAASPRRPPGTLDT